MNLPILDGALARLSEIVDALGADFPPLRLVQYQHVVADRHEQGHRQQRYSLSQYAKRCGDHG